MVHPWKLISVSNLMCITGIVDRHFYSNKKLCIIFLICTDWSYLNPFHVCNSIFLLCLSKDVPFSKKYIFVYSMYSCQCFYEKSVEMVILSCIFLI